MSFRIGQATGILGVWVATWYVGGDDLSTGFKAGFAGFFTLVVLLVDNKRSDGDGGA